MRPAIEAGLMLFVEAATLFMRPVLEFIGFGTISTSALDD
jgi:hypothetical protein